MGRRTAAGRWSWQFEPATEFALRELQHIRLKDCVTASVILTKFDFERTSTADVARLSFEWDEILGVVDINPGQFNAIQQLRLAETSCPGIRS